MRFMLRWERKVKLISQNALSDISGSLRAGSVNQLDCVQLKMIQSGAAGNAGIEGL